MFMPHKGLGVTSSLTARALTPDGKPLQPSLLASEFAELVDAAIVSVA